MCHGCRPCFDEVYLVGILRKLLAAKREQNAYAGRHEEGGESSFWVFKGLEEGIQVFHSFEDKECGSLQDDGVEFRETPDVVHRPAD